MTITEYLVSLADAATDRVSETRLRTAACATMHTEELQRIATKAAAAAAADARAAKRKKPKVKAKAKVIRAASRRHRATR